jgi:membrane-associated phospholipid phosphatase
VLAAGTITADTFWLAVLVSVLPCYGLLPLVATRPPRALLTPPPGVAAHQSLARQANVRFLSTFGNGWNTLPSGHAAGAAAIALLVSRSGSPLAPLFILLAGGIALGTVRGRYHYAVDTVVGVALGLAAGLLRLNP